jgi:hypothetical protein
MTTHCGFLFLGKSPHGYHYYIPEIEIFLDYRANLRKGKDFEDECG